MAESLVFNLSCQILSVIASPTVKKAYEKGLSIWEAKDELAKLQKTIETIQAVLHDAEKKQQDSAAVKNWIKRLKDVLYDADDLFDEVATNELLKKETMKENKKNFLGKQVQVSCFNLNPIIFRNSIAKKVKAIRESLLSISAEIAQLHFASNLPGKPIYDTETGRDMGSFVEPKIVVGRDEDKKAVLEMLVKESDNVPTVIAMVGIGGMAKSTLAQLVYNDDVAKDTFKERWFACVSNTSDEIELIGKTFQSISGENYRSFNVSQLREKISELIMGKKFLLVLDDVWDDNRDSWLDRISLLNGGAKGSKIIVTTRFPFVANVVGASETLTLRGLSDDDSWELFVRVAFVPGDLNDPRRKEVAKKILNKWKCSLSH